MSRLQQSEMRKAVLLSGFGVQPAMKTTAIYEKPMPAMVPVQVAQVSFRNAQIKWLSRHKTCPAQT